MAPFEALYGRRCRTLTCWTETGESRLLGPDMVRATVEKIQVIKKHMLAAQSRQKSYADRRRKDIEFEVGDFVFLKVSPWKGVVRFGKKGKLSPRYIGPYEIVTRVGPVAYELKLPSSLEQVHNVFHVSMLRKYVPHPSHVLQQNQVEVTRDLSYQEQPVQILDCKERMLGRKTIPVVKVLWRNHTIEEATWETEEQMRKDYPYLFEGQNPSNS